MEDPSYGPAGGSDPSHHNNRVIYMDHCQMMMVGDGEGRWLVMIRDGQLMSEIDDG